MVRGGVSGVRVLQVCQPANGGVANHVLALCEGLRDRGWHVDAVCSPGALAEELQGRGFDARSLPLVRRPSPREDLGCVVGLRRIVREGAYSLVHAHSAKGGAVGRVSARLARTPVLYTPHAWSFLVARGPVERGAYVAVEGALGLVSAGIICVSSDEMDLGRRHLRGCGDKLELVPNGIDPPPRTGRRPPGEEVVVGALARLTRQKGIEYLARAAAGMRGRRVRFVVAGDGPDLAGLRGEVDRLGLGGRFEFRGPVAGPWEFFAGIDVFALPSLWEGMPLVVLEAMAFGLPVVATDVGGVRDAIPDETFGAVVPPADPGALAAAIRRYADSSRLRERVGDAAQRRALARFTRDRMVERTIGVYESVLASRRARRRSGDRPDYPGAAGRGGRGVEPAGGTGR